MRIHYRNRGILSGEWEKTVTSEELLEEIGDSKILIGFFEDDTIREITLVSGTMGFVKTFTKVIAF